jgi:hypothetical protein
MSQLPSGTTWPLALRNEHPSRWADDVLALMTRKTATTLAARRAIKTRARPDFKDIDDPMVSAGSNPGPISQLAPSIVGQQLFVDEQDWAGWTHSSGATVVSSTWQATLRIPSRDSPNRG